MRNRIQEELKLYNSWNSHTKLVHDELKANKGVEIIEEEEEGWRGKLTDINVAGITFHFLYRKTFGKCVSAQKKTG